MNELFNYVIYPITGLLGILGIIYGAFLFMTSQGNVEQIQRGKRWIYGAIVGMIFNFSIILIIKTLLNILGVN